MKKSFSLIELLTGLIVVSLLLSAFAPLITKKLKASNITVGSFGNEGQVIECKEGYHQIGSKCYIDIENCIDYGATNKCIACDSDYVLYNNACYASISNCKTQKGNACTICNDNYSLTNGICYPKIDNCETQNENTCTVCSTGYETTSDGSCIQSCNCTNGTCSTGTAYCTSCNSGYILLNKTCLTCSPSNGLVTTGSLCVMQYNIGEGKYNEDWNGVQKCIAGNSCTVANGNSASVTVDNLTPTCWQGTTSASCNSNFGGYSGCTRAVCNWTGGNKLCTNTGWRLPTFSELQSFYTYSNSTLSSNGLMFCDRSGTSVKHPICGNLTDGCIGTYNGCEAYAVWSSTLSSTSEARYLGLNVNWNNNVTPLSHGLSARCVKDL